MSTTPPPPPPPPPPEDPFPNFGNGDNPDPFANGDDEPLDQGRPEVAASPGRVMLVMGLVGAALLFLLYNIFFSGGDEKPPAPEQVTVAPPTVAPPPLPEEVKQVAPPPPVFVPPTVPVPTDLPMLAPKDDGSAKERQQARIRSSMMLSDSSGGGLGGVFGGSSNEDASFDDENSQFGSKVMKANTKADRVTATHIGALNRTIAQGRLIQAVTESAINTDLPAPIRAIVSRDVYGESGTEALIPKGSRLIGQYNTQLMGGQSRVYVMWTRVIRPDGVDVMLGSPLVDQIGMAGIGGQVDTKFQQVFSRALMASVVTIAFAIGSDEISGGDGTTSTTSSTFGTTQAGDGATTATVNALNRLGSTTDSFLRKFIDAGPTILVDQGTPVNVFVNRDLVFPAEFSGSRVIP